MKLFVLQSLFSAILLVSVGCSGPSSVFKPEDYYQEYFVFTDSNTDSTTTCQASFKNTKDKMYHQLPEGYSVCLDDSPLAFDKDETTRNYTAKKTLKEVTGDHVWKIKDRGKSVSEVPFTIKPFKLISSFPEGEIGSKDIVLQFDGLSDGDRLECDYENADEEIEDFEFFYIVKNNSITIPATDVVKLKPGAYKIWIDYVWDKPVIQDGVKTGRILADYGLNPIPVTIRHQK